MRPSALSRLALAGLFLVLVPGASMGEPSEPPRGHVPGSPISRASREPVPEEDRSLLRRPDEKRPKKQLTLDLWGRPLIFGWSYETRLRFEDDLAFKDQRVDDLFRVGQRLSPNLFYRVTEQASLYVKGSAVYVSRRKDFEGHQRGLDDDRSSDKGLTLNEGWLFVRNLFDTRLSFQGGRQRFSEKREWWWDEDLDAIRFHYDRSKLHLEAGVGQQLFRRSTIESHIDPEEEDVLRFFGRAAWEWKKKNRLELYFLSQNDHSDTEPACPRPPFVDANCASNFMQIKPKEEDESDANLTWRGLSARGRWPLGSVGRLHYWADSAVVSGRETFLDYSGAKDNRYVNSRTRHSVRGWGFDVGATWETRLPGRPSFTLGYAVGSGDVREDSPKSDDQASNDHSFRQSGLQDNNGRFLGVDPFKYYGELLEPELSNLRIATAALGFRFLSESSVEFLYHSYQQVDAAKFLRDATVRRQPAGRKRGIGHEFDLVIGIEEWEHVEIELVGAAFQAGPAYGEHCDDSDGCPDQNDRNHVPESEGDWSYLANFKLKFNF